MHLQDLESLIDRTLAFDFGKRHLKVMLAVIRLAQKGRPMSQTGVKNLTGMRLPNISSAVKDLVSMNVLKHNEDDRRILVLCDATQWTVPQDKPARISPKLRQITNRQQAASPNSSSSPKPSESGIIDNPVGDISNRLLNHWREAFGRTSRAKPRKVEILKIGDRLKEGFSEQDMLNAIIGCSRAQPGKSGGRVKCIELDLILQDSAHVNRYMELKDTSPILGGPHQLLDKGVQAAF